jgi:hypothetical protein
MRSNHLLHKTVRPDRDSPGTRHSPLVASPTTATPRSPLEAPFRSIQTFATRILDHLHESSAPSSTPAAHADPLDGGSVSRRGSNASTDLFSPDASDSEYRSNRSLKSSLDLPSKKGSGHARLHALRSAGSKSIPSLPPMDDAESLAEGSQSRASVASSGQEKLSKSQRARSRFKATVNVVRGMHAMNDVYGRRLDVVESQSGCRVAVDGPVFCAKRVEREVEEATEEEHARWSECVCSFAWSALIVGAD